MSTQVDPQALTASDDITVNDVMTADEAAELLRVHISTVHQMCREGALPAVKAGRDWRISRAGVNEKMHLGDVHTSLVERISERAAEKVTARITELFAGAFNTAASRQQVDQYERHRR